MCCAPQIRSHAQKYFQKVLKTGALATIPPPRPKRKSVDASAHGEKRRKVRALAAVVAYLHLNSVWELHAVEVHALKLESWFNNRAARTYTRNRVTHAKPAAISFSEVLFVDVGGLIVAGRPVQYSFCHDESSASS